MRVVEAVIWQILFTGVLEVGDEKRVIKREQGIRKRFWSIYHKRNLMWHSL